MKTTRIVDLVIVFAAIHYVAGAISSAVAIYLFAYWDPKWGDQWGAFQMDLTQFLPAFTIISSVGTALGLVAGWRWLKHLAYRKALAISALVAIAYVLILDGLVYGGLEMDSATGDWLEAISNVWMLGGALLLWIIVAIAVSRRPLSRQAV